ncbi:hypothetical protein MTO96_007730 [Rhipicephalus appendiculatus]
MLSDQPLHNGSAVESSGSAAAACFGMPRAERVPCDIRGSQAEICSEPSDVDSESSSESDSEESTRDETQRSAPPDSNDELNQPLYPGSRVTVAESLLLVLGHSLRHDASREATESLLNLLNAHLPEGNINANVKVLVLQAFQQC